MPTSTQVQLQVGILDTYFKMQPCMRDQIIRNIQCSHCSGKHYPGVVEEMNGSLLLSQWMSHGWLNGGESFKYSFFEWWKEFFTVLYIIQYLCHQSSWWTTWKMILYHLKSMEIFTFYTFLPQIWKCFPKKSINLRNML